MTNSRRLFRILALALAGAALTACHFHGCRPYRHCHSLSLHCHR